MQNYWLGCSFQYIVTESFKTITIHFCSFLVFVSYSAQETKFGKSLQEIKKSIIVMILSSSSDGSVNWP